MNHARAPTAPMAANPHPTPMPAAAPPLSAEELLVGSGAPAAPAAAVVEDGVAEEEVVPDGDDEMMVAADPSDVVCAADVEVVVVCVAVPEATVAVSNRARWRGMVSPLVALGWLSHPDFITLRTADTNVSAPYREKVHAACILQLPNTTDPVPACRHEAH